MRDQTTANEERDKVEDLLLPPEADLTEFLNLIRAVEGTGSAFSARELENVLDWCEPIDPRVYARALGALLSAHSDPSMEHACAEAIGALDEWHKLLLEVVPAMHPRSSASVLREVVSRRNPDHPMAAGSYNPAAATVIYDARRVLAGLFVSENHDLSGASHWLLLSLADPVAIFAAVGCTICDDGYVLTGADAEWLEPRRVTAPGFLAVPALG